MSRNKTVTLKEKVARQILRDVHDEYFSDSIENSSYINGKHQAEILAEQAMKEGLRPLAEGITAVHSVMRCLQKGDYKTVLKSMTKTEKYDFKEEANGTRFQEAAEHLVEPINRIIKAVNEDICLSADGKTEDSLDIDASSQVLKKVKEKLYPGRLSMIEKLDKWQKNEERDR